LLVDDYSDWWGESWVHAMSFNCVLASPYREG
jgi:hypothetical protein